ncbi:killer cell lectin-like receptor subfamily B member 1B allele A [Melanotaenia boesemani]|uniref:killer cell lectin-like receptor subfamily B member 1B allele A n=1 Tax=Melanotaenia boesemani TaxID=1250792 RepID=UPI001C05D193|nr:killer cell lectin-like receptor subfamily B member 1B allele A [Melanotaenia boesemani]
MPFKKPDFTATVRYNNGVWEDDGIKVEGGDVSGDAVTFTGGQAGPPWRDKHSQPSSSYQKTPFRPAPVILGLLCLLLLVGISVLFKLYVAAVLKIKQPITEFEESIRHSSDNLSSSFCRFKTENQAEWEKAEWHRIGCRCYYMSTEKKNWTESQKDCERRGATLLIINSKLKHELLTNLIKRGDNEDSWIGLERVATKEWRKKWQWVDGSEPKYTVWEADINVNPEEDSKVYTDPHGKWNYRTNGSKYWICERKLFEVVA